MPPYLFISSARPELHGATPVVMDAHERAWLATSEHGVANGELVTPECGLIAGRTRNCGL